VRMTPPPASLPDAAEHLAGDTWYLPGLTNAGLVDSLGIDTGPDESAYEGIPVESLVITHGHADHFACAAVLRERGARVYAARDDATLVENPEVNIRGMFSWAKPGDLLVTRLFRGDPCEVDGYLEDFQDPRATAIPLPGHTMGHTGFLTRDRVFFTGDALYLRELWERHRLPYCIDPTAVAGSLAKMLTLDFDILVPAHGHPVSREEAQRDIAHHQGQIAEIQFLILDRLKQERTTEEAIAIVSAERGLGDNPAQYWLAVTTVKGFLGDLLGSGQLEFFVRDHAGWWRTAR
jgi:glyoxylase-like metal-dependent hydrolase (beta-lactamase superfamily II)